ncbi:CapA family protein [Treponema rectale]|uniref:CapA family protein n=1 Tax=Treponema rectale TaxID=744512 RepID=A0A840SAM3_9SPIR|nr:CapA family protein [Treponema rectale]MBB5217845.1 poly-gamma-glutamate synthesis protein (capsule biosynthesis protein) [Treponema rectale]QOS40430.1 CapA family protein [Treponema rectale]
MNSASSFCFRNIILSSAASLFLLSCASTSGTEEVVFKTSDTLFDGTNNITLTFAGDIMAHKPNWNISNFDEVYEDIKDFLLQSDAAFVNLETPVTDSLPYSSYPAFNVHHQYADAAVKAGFNVFSLCNNHTNDQELEGIKATKKYFDEKRTATAGSSRPVYSSGVKDSPSSPFTFETINIRDWKIVYLAVTELLNKPNYNSYINYIKTDSKSRENFIELVKKIREENPCDLFILSFHTAEEEYVLTTKKSQRSFYKKLLDAGVDIINANHPHVPKEWELYRSKEGASDKIIFYSQGNTISAQRTSPSYDAPDTIRDYTGEGFITQVKFEKLINDGKPIVKVVQVHPVLITTYITNQWHFVIKKLDDSFIEELKKQGKKTWSAYLHKRMLLMEKIKGKLIWE